MLDDLKKIRELDNSNMIGRVMSIAAMVQSGYRLGNNIPIEKGGKVRGIHFLGLGGSAIGGDFAGDWIGHSIPGGVTVERGYTLSRPPATNSLIICCSYSGNTKETLSMLGEINKKRSRGILLISSNGKLLEISKEKKIPILELEPGLPPRASLPMIIGAISAISDRIGWTRSASEELLSASVSAGKYASSVLAPEIPTEMNPAKQLAHQMHGFIPVAISPHTMQSIAARFHSQMNENAKQHCFFSTFPEASHNEIVPWLRDRKSSLLLPVILRDFDEGLQLRRDLDRFRDTIAGSTRIAELRSVGNTRIEYLLNFLSIIDLASVYHGILSGLDPTPVTEIESFKASGK